MAHFVFSRRADIEELSYELDVFLAEWAENVARTRKGRVWDFWTIDGRPFSLNLRHTGDILAEIEDDLLALDLLPEDAPIVLQISSGCGRPEDLAHMRHLVAELESLTTGLGTEPI